ncbi:MAG TPA: hypothetical protein VJ843_02150 [Candidatus Saccharimonadales bacterium]|nr:hypothetical protein [Candidatus Saccharimonadales bacterium]
MKKVLIIFALALGVLAGVPAAQAAAAPYCGITWGSGAKSSATSTTRPLTNIRTGQHDCYDRMVFDLSGTAATGYSVQYVSNVYAEGSGVLIPLSGGAKLQIVVRAPAYNSMGQSTYPGVVGAKLPGVNLTGYKTFRDAKFAGSFEGQTTVGLGVRTLLPFRVTTSGNHVIIDVAHKW